MAAGRFVSDGHQLLAGILFVALMKIVLYNPLSLAAAERPEDISVQLKTADVVLLPGTQLRKTDFAAHTTFRHENHLHVSWGYGRSPFVNRACGVSIYLGKRIRTKQITTVYDPPQHLNR